MSQTGPWTKYEFQQSMLSDDKSLTPIFLELAEAVIERGTAVARADKSALAAERNTDDADAF
jgi:hypothetical protein